MAAARYLVYFSFNILHTVLYICLSFTYLFLAIIITLRTTRADVKVSWQFLRRSAKMRFTKTKYPRKEKPGDESYWVIARTLGMSLTELSRTRCVIKTYCDVKHSLCSYVRYERESDNFDYCVAVFFLLSELTLKAQRRGKTFLLFFFENIFFLYGRTKR